MADLGAIFKELGHAGLVPHAIRENSPGWKMLLEKIIEGTPLYLLMTDMDVPFLSVHSGCYHALAFTSADYAEDKMVSLLHEKYSVRTKEISFWDGNANSLQWIFDCGPTNLLIDDTISIPLSCFIDIPNYDGLPNSEHLLRNNSLNGALFYYLQIVAANMSNREAELQWAKSMISSFFLIPAVDDEKKDYPILFLQSKGKACIPVYTDWRQMSLAFSDHPIGLIYSFDSLEKLAAAYPRMDFILNSETCHLKLDQNILFLIRRLQSEDNSILKIGERRDGSKLISYPEEDWEKIDPTPDWLK